MLGSSTISPDKNIFWFTLDSKTFGVGTSTWWNLKIPKENAKTKIETRIPCLRRQAQSLFAIRTKNISNEKEIIPDKTTKYIFTKIKERNNTPNKNPKQIV